MCLIHVGLKVHLWRPGEYSRSFLEVICFIPTEVEHVASHGGLFYIVFFLRRLPQRDSLGENMHVLNFYDETETEIIVELCILVPVSSNMVGKKMSCDYFLVGLWRADPPRSDPPAFRPLHPDTHTHTDLYQSPW